MLSISQIKHYCLPFSSLCIQAKIKMENFLIWAKLIKLSVKSVPSVYIYSTDFPLKIQFGMSHHKDRIL